MFLNPDNESRRSLPLILLAGIFAIASGIIVIAGWVFHIEILKSVFPGLATMKFNTALCFILAGAALILLLN
jgi:hypothetical protein